MTAVDLHHALSDGHALTGVGHHLMVLADPVIPVPVTLTAGIVVAVVVVLVVRPPVERVR